MSLNSCLNIAQQALLVNQAALSVVSNNIANVDTEGYSKQRVNLTPSVSFSAIGGSVLQQINSSTGVEISSVERYTDTYLETYCRDQNSELFYLNQMSNVATSIEDIMNELSGTGLTAAFSDFYDAAQTLSANPKDSVARTNYIQQAQTVALKFNSMSSSLEGIRTSLVGDITNPSSLSTAKVYTDVIDINQKLEQITDINKQIIQMSSGNVSPNNLLDIRGQLLDDLSDFMPVTVSENTNGSINVSLNGLELIKGDKLNGTFMVKQGSSSATPAVIDFVDENNIKVAENVNDYFDSGELGAILAAGGSGTSTLTVKGVMDDLDKLAKGFAQIINDIQTLADGNQTPMAIDKDTDLLIVADKPIFESTITGVDISAKNISVNGEILQDPFLIAAARVDITNYQTNAIGNNSNMQLVLESRTGAFDSLGKSNPEGYLSSLVGTIGLDVENIETSAKNQQLVLTQAQTQLSSATGVSLDEELIDLTKYQSAYQASARIFTVCNELLDVLMALGL